MLIGKIKWFLRIFLKTSLNLKLIVLQKYNFLIYRAEPNSNSYLQTIDVGDVVFEPGFNKEIEITGEGWQLVFLGKPFDIEASETKDQVKKEVQESSNR